MKRLAVWTAGGTSVAAAVVLGLLAIGNEPLSAQQAGSASVLALDCSIQLMDVATLAAERPGILEFVEPEEGDPVRTGQEVAGLKDGVARATFTKEAERALNDVHIRYAMKSREVAVAEYEMSLEANRKVPGTVPEVELKKLKLAAEKAALQIEQAQHEQRIAELTVDENREQLKTYKVLSEFDGIVSKVYLKKGEAVQQGTPILEVLSTSRVKIEGYVSIPDSYRIKAGHPVRVQLHSEEFDLPNKDVVFEGKVRFVDPRVSQLIGRVKLYAEVENVKGILRPGLNAKMWILPQQAVETARTGN